MKVLINGLEMEVDEFKKLKASKKEVKVRQTRKSRVMGVVKIDTLKEVVVETKPTNKKELRWGPGRRPDHFVKIAGVEDTYVCYEDKQIGFKFDGYAFILDLKSKEGHYVQNNQLG